MVQVADSAEGTAAAPVARTGLSARIRALDVVLVAAIVVAAVLRFWHIGAQSLWYDEWVTTDDLSKRLAEMVLVTVPQNEGSPPLYFLIGWFWVRILGGGDGMLRSLSAIVGVATVPVAYLLACELRLRRTMARIAAVLVAVNPMLVWYSQEARPYALFAFLGSLSILLCARAAHDDRTANFVWWGVVAAAALSTHYFAATIIVPEVAWLAYAWRPNYRKVALGCIPIVVVGIPLFKLLLDQQGINQDWIADFHIGQRLAEAGRGYLLGPAQPFHEWWPLLAAVLIGAAVVGAVLGDRHERTVLGGMLGIASFGLVVSFFAMLVGSDYFLGRNLIVSVVPLAIVAAIGLGNVRIGRLGVVIAALVAVAWVGVGLTVTNDSDYQKADWRAVAGLVAHGPRDRAVVVDGYLGSPILRYVNDSRALRPSKVAKVRAIDLVYRIPDPKFHCGRWSGLGCEAFLFPRLPKALERNFALVDRREFAGFVVNRYRSPVPAVVSGTLLLDKPKALRGFVLLPYKSIHTYRVHRGHHSD